MIPISSTKPIFLNNTSIQTIQIWNTIALSMIASKKTTTFIMNDEHFEEVNEIVFPTPSKVAKVLKIDENFPTVKQVKTTKLEATGQILEYTETYKRGDYYKIKFISCSRDH